MIYGIFHKGSGLGNQLHRYVATRSLAEQKGYEFGMVAPELFKGASFMNLDMGIKKDIPHIIDVTSGRVIPTNTNVAKDASWLPVWQESTNYYNPEFNFIEDNTIIDGEFQDERYFDIEKIDKWLPVKPLMCIDGDSCEDLCVIGFRGGEFTIFPELFLPREYWDKAIKMMLEINPKMKFEIHTDDEEAARGMFWSRDFHPNVIHDIDLNWRSMRYAKYAIIANSSFYILPRLLSKGYTIAPRYWARHNTKEWNMPQNYYKSFTYI